MEAHRECKNQHLALSARTSLKCCTTSLKTCLIGCKCQDIQSGRIGVHSGPRDLLDACSDPEVPPAASEDEAAPFVSPNKRTAAGALVPPPPPPRNAYAAARREGDSAHRVSDEETQVRCTSKAGLYNPASKAIICFLCLASNLFACNSTALCANEFGLGVQQLELRTSEGLEVLLGQVGASMGPGRQQALQVGRQHGKHAPQPDMHASSSSKVSSFGKECSVHASSVFKVLCCFFG